MLLEVDVVSIGGDSARNQLEFEFPSGGQTAHHFKIKLSSVCSIKSYEKMFFFLNNNKNRFFKTTSIG